MIGNIRYNGRSVKHHGHRARDPAWKLPESDGQLAAAPGNRAHLELFE
jgi:hypothetical protein